MIKLRLWLASVFLPSGYEILQTPPVQKPLPARQEEILSMWQQDVAAMFARRQEAAIRSRSPMVLVIEDPESNQADS